jgi:hypothetical protein
VLPSKAYAVAASVLLRGKAAVCLLDAAQYNATTSIFVFAKEIDHLASTGVLHLYCIIPHFAVGVWQLYFINALLSKLRHCL